MSNIRPLTDGPYRIFSRNQTGGQNNFLATFEGGAVGLSTERATIWFLVFVTASGSYRIWNHGTENVLDATQAANANATTFRQNGSDWQQWAIRAQPSDTTSGVVAYTMSPLSQPTTVLTMANPILNRTPAVPAQLRPTPANGATIGNSQLWVLSTSPGLRAIAGGDTAAVEGLQPGELDEEPVVELRYCEEVESQIAQAEEQIALQAGEE